MITQSCQNCWYNALQYGPLGLAVGYCTQHKKILNDSPSITCALHRRKDLALGRVLEVSAMHRQHYSASAIVRLLDGRDAGNEISDRESDLASLRKDVVGELVSDYGMLSTTIESLAQLKRTTGARAELAMLSLGRGYVSNCVARGGGWTSGLHLYWWTKARLADDPAVGIEDIRYTDGLPPARQIALTGWSIIMLRLAFLEDMAEYARADDDPLATAIGLLDRTAEAIPSFNVPTLLRWLKRNLIPDLDAKLNYKRYADLSNHLREKAVA